MLEVLTIQFQPLLGRQVTLGLLGGLLLGDLRGLLVDEVLASLTVVGSGKYVHGCKLVLDITLAGCLLLGLMSGLMSIVGLVLLSGICAHLG